MQDWLIHLSTNHSVWVYIFIIFFAFAEGPFLSLIFGVLIQLDYFHFLPIYAALMIGDLIGDIVWYYIGFLYGNRFIRRFGKYFSIDEKSVEKVKGIFHTHKHPILFISKITNGFGFALATLMTAGMVELPFSRYLAINVLGQFVWTGFLLSVGYFFGNLYIQVDAILGRMAIIAFFALLFIAFFRYRKYIQNKIKNLDTI